ncbi:hypothetical protein [Pantoea dispersa]|uniref:hypothetical protein n=1 Tax=Pantoea dispersa TaxID=59814 RepID=UPI001F517681|nr:hypothetical protein [Pantoea dispersa]MCI1029634.1 hypothetical protein [Pantoea dispersa]
MTNELTGLLDGGAQLLSSWLPAELRTLLQGGSQLMIAWFETSQLTGPTGVIVIAGLYITGLAMIGIMLGSFSSSHRK